MKDGWTSISGMSSVKSQRTLASDSWRKDLRQIHYVLVSNKGFYKNTTVGSRYRAKLRILITNDRLQHSILFLPHRSTLYHRSTPYRGRKHIITSTTVFLGNGRGINLYTLPTTWLLYFPKSPRKLHGRFKISWSILCHKFDRQSELNWFLSRPTAKQTIQKERGWRLTSAVSVVVNGWQEYYAWHTGLIVSCKNNDSVISSSVDRTRHHSAEQGREAPGECVVTPFGLGNVPWRHRVYPHQFFDHENFD